MKSCPFGKTIKKIKTINPIGVFSCPCPVSFVQRHHPPVPDNEAYANVGRIRCVSHAQQKRTLPERFYEAQLTKTRGSFSAKAMR
jgi:hypothetical protein